MTESHVFDAIDPDLASRIVARRDLFRSSALRLGALASAPIMLAAVSSEAFGQSLPRQIVDILNYALTLEYLESSFYRVALNQADLIPSHTRAVFETIGKHEAAHVSTLKNALGSAAVEKPNFDFTAGGKYADVFQKYETFIGVAQTFEDTGVAAFKGQLPSLNGHGEVLTTALKIHSVEARHAAEVRRLRAERAWVGAFDKPMTKEQVLAVAKPFFAH
jgi:rubrerythrin